MKRWHSYASLLLALLVSGGCVPRRIFWSPDGQRAAIIAEDGLRLCDAQGKLSDVVARDVKLVAWLPDSRRFIAVQTTEAATWEQASAVLSPEKRSVLIGLADRLREEALAHEGDWDQFKPSMAADFSGGELGALLLYVRDHRSEDLPEKLGEKWTEVREFAVDMHVLRIYEVSDLRAAPGPELLQTLNAISELRISPGGRAVACVQASANDALRLTVLPAAGGPPRVVAEQVAAYPDWTADGQYLVYAAVPANVTATQETVQLGMLARRRVADESSALLESFVEPEEKVGILFWPQVKIRCLRDGRIVFSAIEATFPVATQDMPQGASLFSIDPDRQATVTRLVPRAADENLPNGLGLGFFEVSPDEKRISVASAREVAVLTLATGEVQTVFESDAHLEGLPAWRTADELAIVVPPGSEWGSAARPEIVLWSGPDRTRCLSRDWPPMFEQKP
jgi:hypothetical protein